MRGAATAAALAVIFASACHGPPVGEVPLRDGGAGSAGTGGRGGNGGAGRGGGSGSAGMAGSTGIAGTGVAGTGAAGAGGRGGTGAGGSGGGCAPQFQPAMFYISDSGPSHSDGTSTRYYWAEYGQYITVHYATGTSATTHPYKFDASFATTKWDVAVSDSLLNGLANVNGYKIEAWGPLISDSMFQDRQALTGTTTIAVEGSFGYYTLDGGATPGIYRWDGHGTNELYLSYVQLGLVHSQALILRFTPKYLVVGGLNDAWVVDRSTKATQLVFHNNATILDVLPSRPHTTTAGVLFRVEDGLYDATGRDFYLDLTAATLGTPKDLVAAINALATPAGCPSIRYGQGGVLYGPRYVYETDNGLVSVALAADGTPSAPARLTSIQLRYPEVTGEGTLYAAWTPSSQWTYYRVGGL